MAPALYKPLPFDPVGDFAPVGEVAVGHLALVVNPALGVDSVAELVALAKSKPGVLNYSSPGSRAQHLAMELFKQQMAVDIVHVPYNGSAGAVSDVIANQVPMMIMPRAHTAMPFVAAGKLRVLAVSGRQALAARPGPADVQGSRHAGLRHRPLVRIAGAPTPHTPSRWSTGYDHEIALTLAQTDIAQLLARRGLPRRRARPRRSAH